MAALALVHPLSVALARLDWRADLLAHFREPALALSLVGAMVLARASRAGSVVLAALTLWQAGNLATCYAPNPVPPDPQATARLRLVVANVLVDNPDRQGLIDLVRRERPDVLGLVEASRAWLAGLSPIQAEYPWRYDFPAQDDGSGLALWLKQRPRLVERIDPLTTGGNPVVHAVLDLDGRAVHLWLVHFVSPLERPEVLPAGREFEALADLVGLDRGAKLVVGDFNSTDGSPHFARFLSRSGLRDSRIGFGRQGSWPAGSPYRIAIDHAFLSPELAVARRALGGRIGSDHLPLLLEVAPAARLATKDAAQGPQSSAGSGSLPANLTRSAARRSETSRSTSAGSTLASKAGSWAISSVVLDPHDGPNAPISAARTNSDDPTSR